MCILFEVVHCQHGLLESSFVSKPCKDFVVIKLANICFYVFHPLGNGTFSQL